MGKYVEDQLRLRMLLVYRRKLEVVRTNERFHLPQPTSQLHHHLSQPRVSVPIKQLELELAVKLFEQLGKRWR